jgi:hypothetical protein
MGLVEDALRHLCVDVGLCVEGQDSAMEDLSLSEPREALSGALIFERVERALHSGEELRVNLAELSGADAEAHLIALLRLSWSAGGEGGVICGGVAPPRLLHPAIAHHILELLDHARDLIAQAEEPALAGGLGRLDGEGDIMEGGGEGVGDEASHLLHLLTVWADLEGGAVGVEVRAEAEDGVCHGVPPVVVVKSESGSSSMFDTRTASQSESGRASRMSRAKTGK